MQWSTSARHPAPTTITGPPMARRDGVMTTFCPTSASQESNERGRRPVSLESSGLCRCVPTGSRHPLTEAFVRAGVEAGHKRNSDFNGATQDSVGSLPMHPAKWHRLQRGDGLPASRNEQTQISRFSSTPTRREFCSIGIGLVGWSSLATDASNRFKPTRKSSGREHV